ncbi:hypothetical protein ACFYSC_06665 [Streptosporangium sp. NPDC004379]|uniref:hypothetical protein n=1 Tax=Streptosporangium sp. NPDC004379 TaxID=3366189 RepID=UPI0036892466
MIRSRPLAGAVLASVLLAGSVTTAATAAATPVPATPAIATLPAASAVSALAPTGATARPSNGKLLYARLSDGRGVLKIKNGTTRDGVVTLVRGRTKAISLYVRARSTAKTSVVEDGTYRVYFTTGYRFSVSKGRFTRGASYQRFDSRLKFTTTSTSATSWTLTLNPVRGGNARARHISPKDFPA